MGIFSCCFGNNQKQNIPETPTKNVTNQISQSQTQTQTQAQTQTTTEEKSTHSNIATTTIVETIESPIQINDSSNSNHTTAISIEKIENQNIDNESTSNANNVDQKSVSFSPQSVNSDKTSIYAEEIIDYFAESPERKSKHASPTKSEMTSIYDEDILEDFSLPNSPDRNERKQVLVLEDESEISEATS